MCFMCGCISFNHAKGIIYLLSRKYYKILTYEEGIQQFVAKTVRRNYYRGARQVIKMHNFFLDFRMFVVFFSFKNCVSCAFSF